MVLIPVALLTTATTGWRILRYYTGHQPYRTAGPPPALLRVLGPLVIASTLGLLASGIVLIAVGEERSRQTLFTALGQRVDLVTVHQALFIAFAVLAGLHLLARIAPALALASGRAQVRLGQAPPSPAPAAARSSSWPPWRQPSWQSSCCSHSPRAGRTAAAAQPGQPLARRQGRDPRHRRWPPQVNLDTAPGGCWERSCRPWLRWRVRPLRASVVPMAVMEVGQVRMAVPQRLVPERMTVAIRGLRGVPVGAEVDVVLVVVGVLGPLKHVLVLMVRAQDEGDTAAEQHRRHHLDRDDRLGQERPGDDHPDEGREGEHDLTPGGAQVAGAGHPQSSRRHPARPEEAPLTAARSERRTAATGPAS